MTSQPSLLDILFADEPEQPVTVPAAGAVRHFYRCCDCLTVAAVEGERGQQPLGIAVDAYGQPTGKPAGKCGACGGSVEYMGEVARQTLDRVTGYRSVCDFRCTHATGPNCDCHCGGANHGSGAVVPVVEREGVPTLQVKPGARHVGEYWRAACDRLRTAWKARYGFVTELKREGRYVDQTQYALYREGGRIWESYLAVKAGRTAARARKLEALIAEVQERIGAGRIV